VRARERKRPAAGHVGLVHVARTDRTRVVWRSLSGEGHAPGSRGRPQTSSTRRQRADPLVACALHQTRIWKRSPERLRRCTSCQRQHRILQSRRAQIEPPTNQVAKRIQTTRPRHRPRNRRRSR
jgi:hypothetical protein